MYTILVENPKIREEIREYLKNNGIETRPTFYPIHTMPIYCEKYQKHPVAEDISSLGINLPSYPDLEKKDIEFIVKIIKGYFK